VLRIVPTGTVNGSNTAFTLPQTAVAGGLTWVVLNGQLISQVADAPTATQCVLSGASLTMGLAPAVGDDFFVFIQTNLLHGLMQVPLSGVQNSSNLSFTLETAPPAGTSLVFAFNGLLLNQVAAAPTAQQMTVSGVTVGLGLAPTAADTLAAYIADVVSLAFFHRLDVQGSAMKWQATTHLPSGYSPVFAVFINGQLQTAVTGTPQPTQYRQVLTHGVTTFTFGFPLTASDDVQVFLIGFTAPAAALPSLPRYLDLQSELLVLMNERIDNEEAKMCLNRRWQKILNAWSWSFVKSDGVLTTKAPKSAGTVAVQQDSTLIAGTSTAFAASDIGAYLLLGGFRYRVLDVQVISATQQMVLLDSPYTGPSNAALPYQLVYANFALDADVVDIVSMAGPTWPLDEITQESMNVIDTDRSFVGRPSGFVRLGMIDGVYRVELWPAPAERHTVHYVGLTRVVLTDKGQIIPDVAEVLLMAAEEMACGIVSSKCAADKDYQGAQFWNAKGAGRHANYLESLSELKSKDRRRFSGPTGQRERSLSRFVNVPGYDVRF
jgi:hypothetical protein